MTMKTNTMFYLDKRMPIRATWHAPSPPGWTEEGGWLLFGQGLNPDDGTTDTSLTIYLDREQAIRLQQVINDLVAGMDTAGPVFHGHEVVSKAVG